METNEQCVPASAVQNDGKTPDQGADIEVTLKGKVTRVDGGNVYFKATEANGQPIEEDGGAEDLAPAEPTEESLRAAAAQQDQMA